MFIFLLKILVNTYLMILCSISNVPSKSSLSVRGMKGGVSPRKKGLRQKNSKK